MDLISRQAAIEAILTELTKRERKNLLHTWSTVEVKCFIVEMLEQLPSAQPERKKGKWLDDCGGLKCSVCGCTIDDPYYVEGYCTKCGSYNKED